MLSIKIEKLAKFLITHLAEEPSNAKRDTKSLLVLIIRWIFI